MTRRFLSLLTLCLLLLSDQCLASHQMGGEITYECQGNGMYKFRLKFYRDCNGVTPNPTVDIQTTVPSVPIINATLVSVTDISYQGLFSNGTTPCSACGGAPAEGIVEEYLYESLPVQLNGVPPASGWEFTFGDCCRNGALTNIPNAGSLGSGLIAKMYPYNGQNMFPCFDSSPHFYEKPAFIVCTGLDIKYNHLTKDSELDSLVYQFGFPIDDLGSPLTFSPGYSVNSPLPGLSQNSGNVPVSLNPATGEMKFKSLTGGFFAFSVKVSSFKCGVKISEINREINLYLKNNCPPVFSNQPNQAPNLNAPFPDPHNGINDFLCRYRFCW